MADEEIEKKKKESRELLDRARQQVEGLPSWKVSYDVQSEIQKLTQPEGHSASKRRLNS